MSWKQQMVLEKIREILKQGGSPRFLCAKSSQLGISLLIDAFKLTLSLKHPKSEGLVVTPKAIPKKLLGQTRPFEDKS